MLFPAMENRNPENFIWFYTIDQKSYLSFITNFIQINLTQLERCLVKEGLAV